MSVEVEEQPSSIAIATCQSFPPPSLSTSLTVPSRRVAYDRTRVILSTSDSGALPKTQDTYINANHIREPDLGLGVERRRWIAAQGDPSWPS